MTPIRVLLADDHAAFRRSIASLLAGECGFEVIGEACNGHEAVVLTRLLEPDVVLMDVSMPVLDGLAATRRIRKDMPRVRVVILTVGCDAQTTLAARSSGAADCLSKKIDADALLGALRHAMQGAQPA